MAPICGTPKLLLTVPAMAPDSFRSLAARASGSQQKHRP